MKEFIKPKLEIIEIDTEGSILTSSGDQAEFGDPTDEMD